jgi:hypothetical protein
MNRRPSSFRSTSAPTELAGISRAHLYIDTVGIHCDNPLSLHELEQIQKHAKSVQVIHRRAASSLIYKPKHLYMIQLPSRNTLRTLESGDSMAGDGRPSIRVCRVDIAFDVLCSDLTSARRLKRWFSRHLYLTQNPTFDPAVYEDSFYTAPRKWRLQTWNIYPEKRDRHFREPCAHMEIRITGSQNVARLGVRTPQNLVDLDLKACLEPRLSFRRVDYQRLCEVILKSGCENWSKNAKVNRGKRIALQKTNLRGGGIGEAMAIRRFLHDKDISRRKAATVLLPLPHHWLFALI